MKKSILFVVMMLSAQAFAGGSDVGSVGIQSCADQYGCQGNASVAIIRRENGAKTAAMLTIGGEAAELLYNGMTDVKEEPLNVGFTKLGPNIVCMKYQMGSKPATFGCYIVIAGLKNGDL